MESTAGQDNRLMRPIELRRLYGVSSSTLRNWASAGKIRAAQRTAGGHRRYWESEVRSLLAKLEAAVA